MSAPRAIPGGPPGRSGPESFLVGRDRDGHWVAVESGGLRGGLFQTQDAARHYAKAETDRRPGAVRLATRPVVLRF